MTTHRRFQMVAAVLIAGLMAGAGTLAAQDAGATARQWWNNQNVQQKLGLSGEQVSEITRVNQDFGARADAASKTRREAWQALSEAAATDPSGDLFATAADTYQTASAELAALSVERLQLLATILSPEQFAALGNVAPAALAPKVGSSPSGGGGLRSASSPGK